MVEVDYEVVEHTLPNGLRLAVLPDPHAPAVAVNIWYEVGSHDEVAGRTGFAHLFEHLMFQGSADVASGEHLALMESAGGSANATTSSDRTNYFETVPPGALDLALWLEANRMTSLDISETNFEAQREVVKEEKRQRYDNQPYGDLLHLLVGQHYDASAPYGHLTIGSMADLDAATLDDVRAFFAAWYRPSNARVVLAGAVTPADAIALVERHFGDLPALPTPERHPDDTTAAVSGRETTVERDVPHAIVHVSWPAPSDRAEDHLAADIALSILADGSASRLHRELVRSQAVAHEVSGFFLGHLRDRSIISIAARPTDGTTTATLADAIVAAVSAFAVEGPTAEELARAVAQYERDWLLQLATVEGRADIANDEWLSAGSPARLNERLPKLRELTTESIRAAAATHLTPTPSRLHYLTGATR